MIAVLGHWHLVRNSDANWVQAPISDLSQHRNALQHGVYLFLFAISQGLLAWRVEYAQARFLTRCIQGLSIVNALLIACLGCVFALQNATLHTAHLSVIASFAGIIMAGLIARDIGHNKLAISLIMNSAFLLIWLALIPIALLVEENAIGAYQRCVGAVYAGWLCTVALAPVRQTDAPTPA